MERTRRLSDRFLHLGTVCGEDLERRRVERKEELS
jgi:hypothetical protein